MLNMRAMISSKNTKSEKILRSQENSVRMNSGKRTYVDVLKNPSAALNPSVDPTPSSIKMVEYV
jgi:hypothetical protein